MSRGRRLLRAAGLTRNPMLRASDRLEFSVRALLALVFVFVAIPAGLVVGTLAHDNAARSVPAGAHLVSTTVQSIPPDPSAAYSRTVLANLRWTAPDGTLRVGQQAVPRSTRLGDPAVVWTDGADRLIPRPPTNGDQVFTGVLVGLLTATAAASLLALAMVIVRFRVDRRRYARWDAEWRAVEPIWCRH